MDINIIEANILGTSKLKTPDNRYEKQLKTKSTLPKIVFLEEKNTITSNTATLKKTKLLIKMK